MTTLSKAEALERLTDPDLTGEVVWRLAVNRPFGVTEKVGSLYCTLCGAIEGAGDLHQVDCPWRLARQLLDLPTDWPAHVPACPHCQENAR